MAPFQTLRKEWLCSVFSRQNGVIMFSVWFKSAIRMERLSDVWLNSAQKWI
jgi:hypothetical protein